MNPWQLMQWMGHKRIDETMGYVHMVERQQKPIAPEIVHAGEGKADPTARVVAMLGARATVRGNGVATRGALVSTSRLPTAA